MDVGKEVSNHYKIWVWILELYSFIFVFIVLEFVVLKKFFKNPIHSPLGCFSHLSLAFIFSKRFFNVIYVGEMQWALKQIFFSLFFLIQNLKVS